MCKKTKLNRYDALITELHSSATQKFYYVSNLNRYMKDNCELKCSESTFCYHINRNYNCISYFKEGNRPSNADKPVKMFETLPEEQAQIDWKESQSFTASSVQKVIINIFCYILSYSRYRVYFLYLKKERPLLLDFLTQCFELTGGVPKTILTDNMKTVMDKARTENYKGVINKEFEEFSKQMGFKTHPCVACSPQTKSKV
ncbi:MAG: DDE-type integrase/transposase/recombinase [Bacilli bacterium]|nr:DDE-type integrase/transposase/recombinase [Bacilli bacterium]